MSPTAPAGSRRPIVGCSCSSSAARRGSRRSTCPASTRSRSRCRARPSCRARRRRRSSRTRSTRCAASAPSVRRSSRSSTHTRPGSTAATGRGAFRPTPFTANDVIACGRPHRRPVRHERRAGGAELDAPGRAGRRGSARRTPAGCSRTSASRTTRSRPRACRAPSRSRRRRRPRRGAWSSTTAASRAHRSLAPAFASNALLVGAKKSATGHPLFVAGPQVGYFFPELFAEMELTGAGFDVRGAVFPGVPLVLIGRGPDFAWSATSSQADNLDLFVETLCGDDHHYLYRGQCEPMRRFVVGTLREQGQPDQQVSYDETTHGPVIGYATVGGKRVADLAPALDARARAPLGEGVLRPEHRAGGLREGLPLDDERRRVQLQLVLRRRPRHRHVLERPPPAARAPARIPRCRRWAPATSTGAASFRSPAMRRRSTRRRGRSSTGTTGRRRTSARPTRTSRTARSSASISCARRSRRASKHTLATLTGAMNKAATQDLRVVRVWPIVKRRPPDRPGAERACRGGREPPRQLAPERIEPARPRPRRKRGRPRRGGDGRGVAADRRRRHGARARAARRPARAGCTGGATTPGRAARPTSRAGTATSTRICGRCSAARCAGRTRAATAARACSRPAARRCGTRSTPRPPSSRRRRVRLRPRGEPMPTAERIRFASGVLPDTMRWTNRPTFQQLMSFSSHRPR